MTQPTREELEDMEAVAQRAADDFEQRQNNVADYPEDSPEWRIYAMSYGMRLKIARDNGEAV